MDMKSTISAPFGYTSDISIKFECKGHPFVLKFKNTGTKHLFDTITKALCGYPIDNALPETLDVQSNGDTCLRHSVYFTGAVYGDAVNDDSERNYGVLALNTVLTYEDKLSIVKLTDPRLVLRGRDGEELCYIGEAQAGQIQQMWELITQDTNALIEWKLIFNNG